METKSREDQNWTAAEAVEKVEAGILCKGILLCDRIEELTKDREPDIKVKTNLEFKGSRSTQEIFRKHFMLKEVQEVFEKNIDKCTSHQSDSTLLWGMDVTNKQHNVVQTYTCGIHYEMVPIMAVDLTTNTIELKPEVTTALRQIEKSIKPLYRSTGHFKNFFEKFGSHTNYGVVELGGVLMGKAHCQNFTQEAREQKKSRTLELSKKTLQDIFVGHESEYDDDISVTVKKIGGKLESTLKLEWQDSLKVSNSCRVINRNANPKPIWELLIEKHRDDFEKPLLLANAMEEEWGTYTQPEVQARYKGADQLRRKRDMWLEWAKDKDHQFVVEYLKELANLRQKQKVSDEDWREQVVYSSGVQNVLTWAATCRKDSNNLLQKQHLTTAIVDILDPFDKVEPRYFTNLKDIKDCIDFSEKIPERLEITQLTDLPQILSERRMEMDKWVTEEAKCKYIQQCLELTVKHWSEKKENRLQYILCRSVLHLSGFDTKFFRFDFPLPKQDVEGLIKRLEKQFSHFESIAEISKKQAYLVYLSLESKRDRHEALRETLDIIPDISPQITAIMEGAKEGQSNTDLDKFQKDVGHFLEGELLSFDLTPLVNFLKTQFDKIFSMKHQEEMQNASPEESKNELDESINEILNVLDMKKFYPQKLTYEDVIMLTSELKNESTKKPTSLPELPWFFLRQIVALDSNAMENCDVSSQQDFGDESSSDSSDSELDVKMDDSMNGSPDSGAENRNESNNLAKITSVNPLDLIYAIFLCADDFLRQEVIDKMVRCQYSVPFVLPSPNVKERASQNLVLLWALSSLSRLFYDDKKLVHKTLVDVETPIITCMSLGEETSWKSKFLNKMLSPVQDTFWHQGLRGGDCEQKISNGMVEVAWYLPGGHMGEPFLSPLVFTNCRGNALKSPALCEALVDVSSVSCLFVAKINKELRIFLENRPSLSNIILVVLCRKEDESVTKAECKKLRKTLNMEKHQIIHRPVDDANFYFVCEKVKKSIKHKVNNNDNKPTVSTFVKRLKENVNFDIDDTRCHKAQIAAEKILRNIDELNQKKPGSAKAKILPCQSDLQSRREMAALDKELCRQRKRTEKTTLQNYAYDIKRRKLRLQLHQLQKPISESFRHFLEYLFVLKATDRKYFLQILRLGLNERSIQLLQPLYEEYEKCRLEDESEERDSKLALIDEQLNHGSLGVEHFFREMAILYENILAIKSSDFDSILDQLSDVMAEIVMSGVAVEIMNGDSIDVPVEW